MNPLRLTVRDLAGLTTRRPVTGGVPLAQGQAPKGTRFALADAAGRPVPVQTSVLARWHDHSVRWLLLDFQAAPAAGGRAEYVLTADRAPTATDAARGASLPPAAALTGPCGPGLAFGSLSIVPGSPALLEIAQRLELSLAMTDGDGQSCSAVTESAVIEVRGSQRATLCLQGAFRDEAGRRRFQVRLRASIFAGLPLVRLEPLIIVDPDTGIMQHVRDLALVVRPATPVQRARLGGSPGCEGEPVPPVRLFQATDQCFRLESPASTGSWRPIGSAACPWGDGAGPEGGKAPGWIEFTDAAGTVALALREFWQQWPKSLAAAGGQVTLGLLPAFSDGEFGAVQPWFKYQYLFEGNCYRLRTGQARRWDVWLDLSGDGDALARLANTPLVPAADPAQAIATGVWDAIAPAGTRAMAAYDPWAESLFRAYCDSIASQRDYGAMNWGDWFGERQVNWGNHEYDTTNQLLIQFARTGDPRYLHVADAAAHHSVQVDTVHHVNADLAAYFTQNWPTQGFEPRPGMVHEHTVGHVSGFYSVETVRQLFVERDIGAGNPNPYLCMDPFNLGHIWTQGSVRHHFLTGDPFVRETVLRIGDNLAQLVEAGGYDFAIDDPHSGRAVGWPLLALAGAYEIDLDERYLRAMRSLTERILPRQDPHCGGWLYSLYPGHCFCTTRKHVGMAGFITSILVNGLSRYQLLAGHPDLPAAIERAVTFLINDTWREEWQDWRYTSCPASARMHQPGVTVMALVNAVRIAHTPEHLRVLRVAWEAKFRRLLAEPASAGMGKTYSATLYGCAEAAGLLAMDENAQPSLAGACPPAGGGAA